MSSLDGSRTITAVVIGHVRTMNEVKRDAILAVNFDHLSYYREILTNHIVTRLQHWIIIKGMMIILLKFPFSNINPNIRINY